MGQTSNLKRVTSILIFISILAACGGGGTSDSGNPSSGNPPAQDNSNGDSNGGGSGGGSQDPDQPQNNASAYAIVPFDFVQKAQNRAFRGGEIQTQSFVNATGEFRLPIAQQNLTGNLTIAVDVTDPDGINGVLVGFSGATEAIQLCESNCGTDFHRVVTGVNPLDFGLSSGTHRLDLYVLDTQGNQVLINTVEFNWQVTAITGLSTQRTSNNMALTWQPLNNYLRYNVYISTQSGVNRSNYQSLPDGQAFLAIRDPNLDITGKDDAKAFFTSVTGIDASGESAFSSEVKLQALNGEEDFPPTANDDNFTMDEDTELTGNVINNDQDQESQILTINTTPILAPENGSLTLNANGSFSYTPITDFNGRDVFRYQLFDGVNQTAEATVIIDVNAANDAPESSYNTYNLATVNQNQQRNQQRLAELTINAPGLLINDLDIDNNSITVDTVPVTQPTQGTLTLNADGSFTYNNNPDATGEDQFSYRTLDGNGGASAATTVRITINGSSFPPIAATDRYSLNQNQTFSADGSAQGRLSILANDVDLDPNDNLTVSTNLIRTTSNGQVAVATDGTFTYTPNNGFFGNDVFLYEVTDLQGNTAQAGVVLTVNRVNDIPIATADNYNLDEDTTFSANAALGVIANDTDVDFGTLTVDTQPLQAPTNGQLTLSSDGSFTYQPNQNFFGTDSFRYQLQDGQGGSAQGDVTLTVNSINDNPIANDDVQSAEIDTTITVDVLANDSDADGDTLSITTANASSGTLNNNGNNLTLIPNAGFTGAITINYTITDGAGGSASAVATVTYNNANVDPVATADNFSTNEDQSLIVTAANGLLANDTDANNDTLTVNTTPFTPPTNGVVTLNSDGGFNYQPNQDFFGNDNFVYQVLDGQGGSNTAQVTITINSQNDNPVANDDNFVTAEETLVNFNVLANDSDVENDVLTVTSATANNGAVTVLTDNSINYTGNLNFVGTDQINYQISDGNGGTAAATATITVQNVNDPPVAVNDNATTAENTPVDIDVLTNDSDIDGDTLSVLSPTTSQGTATVNGNLVRFTPQTGFNGNATISYTLSDGNGGTDTALITVNVTAVNDQPTATNDNATVDEDTNINIDVLANDTDIDGDTLTVDTATASNGNVTVNSDNTLNYQGFSNFNGQDTINYQISDGNGGSASAQVFVTVIAINDNPIAQDDSANTLEDTTISIDVLANDSDVDNDNAQLSITIANANNGNTTVVGNLINYTPNQQFNGNDQINYQISDGNGGSANATVFISVVAQNDSPIAQNDIATTDEDVSITINPLLNDSDIDNDPLTITQANASQGSANVINNQISYVPTANFNGTDTINYQIDDGNGASASAIITVTINAVNDNPIAVDDSATTTEDTPISINVLANDSDIDSTNLTISGATANNGSANVVDNQLFYTPATNFSGQDSINYQISDNQGGSAAATVTVTVSNVNDAPIAQSDAISINEDNAATINVLANDSDPDGDALSVITAVASQGQAFVNTNNSIDYVPNTNFNGIDVINYTISDNQGGTGSTTVTVTVVAVNDQPIAVNDSAIVDEDVLTIINVLANDSDVDGDTLSVTSAAANSGSVTIQSDQTLSYQPNLDFNGVDTINYSISDGNGGSAQSTVSLSIIAINDNPVANPDSVTLAEDSATNIDVLANDTDLDNDPITIVSAQAAQGSVSIIGNGQVLEYGPPANFNGQTTINYVISDGQGGSANGVVTITITPVNDLPIAVNDEATTPEDNPITINAIANDSDIDGDNLTITTASANTGSTSISNNQIVYQPTADFNGVDSINYQISDGNGGNANGVIAVTITAQNDTPVATNDNATLTEDGSIIINVLANDNDADGDSLTITSATAIQGVSAITDNQITYTPNANFNGNDTISYQISDGQGANANAIVNVTITPVNDLPVALSDTATTNEDIAVTIDALVNDSDIDGDTLNLTAASATQGSATVNNNQINYQPNANFNGTDTINYSINDGNGGQANATVVVTVNAVNDLPEVINESQTLDEDTNVIINVLANDTDPDNDSLTIAQVSAQQGTATILNNQVSYTPNPNFNGSDTISYQVSDGQGAIVNGEVALTINPINDIPIAVSETANLDEDTSLTIDALANDSDVDQDSLTIDSVNATQGSATIVNNQINYQPTANFNGSATINYSISDNNGGIASATISLTINPVNDAPVANDDSSSLLEDTNTSVNVLLNDFDIDGDSFSISTVSASSGDAIINGSSIDYFPTANFNGNVTINYQISDGNGGEASANLNLTITPVNDAPVAVDDAATTPEDTLVTITPLINDTDVDGDTLTITSIAANNGQAVVNNDNSVNYTPNAHYNGLDTITYIVSDGVLTANGIITVNIGATNDIPVAQADSATLDEDGNTNIDVLANDSDADGDQLTIVRASATNGSATIVNNQISYTPNANFNGSDTIDYAISDGAGGNATSTVAITVVAINDAPVAVADTATTQEDIAVSIAVLQNDSDIDGDTITLTTFSALNGEVIVLDNNQLQYTPNQNFNGTDELSYTISDGALTASNIVTITVETVNDAPTAVADTATTSEDIPVSINVLANDSDVDGDTLTVTSYTAGNGSVGLAEGALFYSPNLNFNGNDTINYQISDGNGLTASATVAVTVIAVNDPPTVNIDTATTNEDVLVSIFALDNDSDVDGDTLSITQATAGFGQANISAPNQVDYTPNANFNGSDSISYTVSDGTTTTIGTIAVTVNSVNDNPIAVNDSATTNEDTSIDINVLANDTDIENDTLTITSANAQQGQTSIINQQLAYTPNANFFGTDTISYNISDGKGGSSSATVTITVNAVNDAPVANNDTTTTDEDSNVVIAVLSNDTDADNDALTITAANASNGNVLIETNQLKYVPNANFNGQDTINYTISDGNLTASAIVGVTVTSINDNPIAVNDTASVQEDNSVAILVLDNDSDADNDTLSIKTANASNGNAAIAAGGINYTPNANFNGQDTISYTIEDGQGGSASATVTVTVTAVNDAPITTLDTATTNEDTSTDIDVLLNDTDPDGDTLTITAANASNGGVSIINKQLAYTPNANFFGTDTINYTVTDGSLSANGTVSVNVNAVNDIPVANNDNASVQEDNSVAILVLDNDTDADNDTLTIKTANATNGSAIISGGGINYTPNANFNGQDTISYTIEDGQGGSASAIVGVTVTSVNDAPVAVNDTATTNEDTLVTINVLLNDSDIDGDTLTITNANESHGSISINNNKIDYTPDANYNGSDTINYTISDGNLTASGIVNVTITPVNDNPIAVTDSITTNEDTLVNINVLSNDSDPDGDTLQVDYASENHGFVSIESDNSINYTPDANYNGSDTITYQLSDGKGGSTQGTVTVTITAVNDAPVAVNDTATTAEDTAKTINALANDTDIDGDSLIITNASASNGSANIVSNQISYTPSANFNGTDTINYQISDGGVNSNATITVTVTPVNDDPIANPDTSSTNEDTLVNINVLANDSDPDGNSLTVTNPTASNGAVNVNPDQTLDYVPNPNFNGSDTINFSVSNQSGTVNSSVAMTVNSVNDVPTMSNNSGSIPENSANGTSIYAMSASDVDTGETLTFSIQTNSASIFGINSSTGLISVADNTSLNFESATRHDIVVKVQDAAGDSTTATATINVTNVEENVTPTLDSSFASNGTAGANAMITGRYAIPTDAILDSNGKLIVVGRNSYYGTDADIFIARYNTDGSLDRSFGHQGLVTKDLGNAEYTTAVNLDASGNIVVVGHYPDAYNGSVFIARFLSTGAIDTSFNSNGYLQVGDDSTSDVGGVEFDASGNIYVGMSYLPATPALAAEHRAAAAIVSGFKLMKYQSDGTFVSSTTADFESTPNFATNTVKQSDGKIIITGTAYSSSAGQNFAAARFDIGASVSLDSSYGNSGTLSIDFGDNQDDGSFDSILNSNDDLYIVGQSFGLSATYSDLSALQLDNTGALITGFGSNGLLVVDLDNDGTGTGNQSAGRSIAVDSAGQLYFGADIGINSNKDFAVYKTNTNGVVQSAYATSGKVEININNSINYLFKLLTDSSDQIIFAATEESNIESDVVVGQLNTSGVLNSSYGDNGFNVLDPTFSNDVFEQFIELTVAPNAGKYVAIGSTSDGVESRLIITRFNTDGSIDDDFGQNGYYVKRGVEQDYQGKDIVEQSDGKLVFAGTFAGEGYISRLNVDGSLDTSFATSGSYTTSHYAQVIYNAVALDSGNNIIAAGTINDSGDDMYFTRLTSTGSLDTSFNAGGSAQIDLTLQETVEDIAVLSDNSIIAVGSKSGFALVAKVTSSGTLDTSNFGDSGDGYRSVDLNTISGSNSDNLYQVKVKSDGTIVAVGESNDSGSIAMALQLTSAGAQDSAFDSDGIATVAGNANESIAYGLAFDASERLVISGYQSNGSNKDIMIARLSSTGVADTLFNTTGSKLFDYNAEEQVKSVIVRSDGSLMLGGSGTLNNLFPSNFFFMQKINLIEP